MSSVRSCGCDLYYEEAGEGVPILLIPPAGSTASTWGAAADGLARIGRVIAYDRRGYARSSGGPPRRMSVHTADAGAALADFVNSIGTHPSRTDLATVEVPVVCTYGARSHDNMSRLVRFLAAAIPTGRTHRIEGAGHAAPFDAPTTFVGLIGDIIASRYMRPLRGRGYGVVTPCSTTGPST
jgi:pimeloyl-ACP methyl ester carboxylesterase